MSTFNTQEKPVALEKPVIGTVIILWSTVLKHPVGCAQKEFKYVFYNTIFSLYLFKIKLDKFSWAKAGWLHTPLN